MTNLDVLKVFLEVVKLGSFAEAARKLNQPTTTISRKIQQLEEELGARLIHRTTRSQSLTEAGALAVPKAEAVLASLQELTDEVSQKVHSPKGTLKIAGPATILRDFATAFAKFSTQYPDVQLQFESSSRYQNLIDDHLDFAFRVGPLSDSSVIARRIQTISNYVVASPSFLEGKTPPEQPTDLSNWRCIRTHIEGFESPWVFSNEKKTQLVQPKGQFLSDDLAFCLKLTQQGIGVAYLAENLVRSYLENKTLEAITFKGWKPTARDLFLVYQEKAYLPPKSRAFVEFFAGSENFRSI